MNVQYLQNPTAPKTTDLDPHQIFKNVARRITVRAKEDSTELEEALAADKAHDKKLEEEIEQLKKDLEAKQKEKDEISQAAAGAQLELIAAQEKQVLEEEQIKKLGEAAEASSKAVKALEEDITTCNVKFKNLLQEKENISKKLKNQKLSGIECNNGRARDKKKAADSEAELLQTMLGQRKLKEQYKEDIKVKQEECAKESQKRYKELFEKNNEISKLADDVKREAASVLEANKNEDILRESVNEKTDEIAKLESKINSLLAENKKLKENSSGIPDGTYKVNVCRPMGKKKICGAEEDLEVKNGRLAKPLTGAKPGDDLLKVEKTKNGYSAIAPRLKFNPLIKF